MSPTDLLSIPVIVIAALGPGLAVVVLSGPRGLGAAATVGTALAISPGLMGASVGCLMLLGMPLAAAAVSTLVVFAGVGILGMLVRRRHEPAAEAGKEPQRLAWILAIAAAVGVALFPLFSEWWRVYSDAWNHVMIVRTIVENGLPPQNPYFAGLKLQYMWVYHVYTAAVVSLTGVDAFVLFAVWSSVAMLACVLGVAHLAFRLHGRHVAGAVLLVLFGMNALFPLFAPLMLAKAMIGEVRGWDEVARTFQIFPLSWENARNVLGGLGGQYFFLTKFMVATAFSIGLAAYIAWCACLLRWFRSGTSRDLYFAGALTLVGGLVHPVVAVDVVATTAGLAISALVVGERLGVARRRVFLWAGAVGVGFIPVAAFIVFIAGGQGGSHGQLPIDVSMWKVVGLLTTVALGLLAAAGPWWQWLRADGVRRVWAVWLGGTLVLALIFRLPGPTSYFTIDKFAYFVWIPLALTGAAAMSDWLRRRGRVGGLVLAVLIFVPVNGLALAGRIFDPQASVQQPWHHPGFEWIREHTPRDAVLIVPHGDLDTPVLASRHPYMSDIGLGLQLGHPASEIRSRVELVERYYRTGELAEEDMQRLEELDRPVYAVWPDYSEAMWRGMPAMYLATEPPSVARRPGPGAAGVVFAAPGFVVVELVPPK